MISKQLQITIRDDDYPAKYFATTCHQRVNMMHALFYLIYLFYFIFYTYFI